MAYRQALVSHNSLPKHTPLAPSARPKESRACNVMDNSAHNICTQFVVQVVIFLWTRIKINYVNRERRVLKTKAPKNTGTISHLLPRIRSVPTAKSRDRLRRVVSRCNISVQTEQTMIKYERQEHKKKQFLPALSYLSVPKARSRHQDAGTGKR